MSRTPPNDPACEQMVLSCVFLDGVETIAKAQETGVHSGAFFNPSNQLIWDTMLALVSAGKDPSIEHVALELTTKGTLDAAGGYPYLMEVSERMPTTAQRTPFLERLVELHRLRELAKEGQAIVDAVHSYQGEGVETAFSAKVAKLTSTLSGSEEGPQTLAEYAERAARAVESPETAITVHSGWPSWDRIATPLRAGEMITLAARPGMGKSALAALIANRLTHKEQPVDFFSLEMQGEELIARMALQRGGRELLNDPVRQAKMIREIGKSKFLRMFDSRRAYSMTGIESRARLNAANGGISLLIIDYLQLITPTDRRVPREQQVAEISRRCKQLAGEIEAPVMVLAQLNREVEKHDRRPILSDLRESGAIEQDSDRVWFIHQDAKDVVNLEASQQDYQLIQAKCRNGPGSVSMKFRFDKPVFTFTPTIVL